GTHIAGIIGANKDEQGMHGVAFENAKILASSWDTVSAKFDAMKYLVDDGAVVINNSWGSNKIVDEDGNLVKLVDMRNAGEYLLDDEDIIKSYTYSANNGVVWVQSTGNGEFGEPLDQPSIYVGLPTLDLSDYTVKKEDGTDDKSFAYAGPLENEVPLIAVTAIDPNITTKDAPKGIIAGVNPCGNAGAWCLAAPGANINSSEALPEGLIPMSGTSMAAPVVSGSIALLKGYYNWLSAQNIAYLLLETADKSGAYANEAVYGQGVLDLEAAVTTPIKGLGLPESADLNSVKSAGLSKIYTGSVMGSRLKKALPKTITAYDALKRPFQYDSSNLVDVTHSGSARLKSEVSRLALGESGKKVIKDEKSGFSFSSSESMDSSGKAHLTTAEVERESQNGKTRFYYAENSKYMTSDEALINTSNPYFSMRDAYGAENTLNLSETSRLKLSIQSGENGLYERDDEKDKNSFDERSYAMSAEYSFNPTDYLELNTLGGMLFEEDAMLGLNGIGSLGLSNTSTYYMGLKAKLDLSSNVSLLAAYYRGYTMGNDSQLLSISNLETESFMVAGEYSFNKDNKVGLMFESPMSVVKGNSTFKYSTGRDNNSNTAYMSKLKTSLKPEAKEYDLGMYFKSKPIEDLSLSGKVQARFNADGEKGVDDYMGVIGAQYNF
ncbi:MAG: S8 family serine peptidase, partial [Alphaproteobacteria bacterium]|nr:S8 family serine peptidase [Alphaproteobacteria bacterium]